MQRLILTLATVVLVAVVVILVRDDTSTSGDDLAPPGATEVDVGRRSPDEPMVGEPAQAQALEPPALVVDPTAVDQTAVNVATAAPDALTIRVVDDHGRDVRDASIWIGDGTTSWQDAWNLTLQGASGRATGLAASAQTGPRIVGSEQLAARLHVAAFAADLATLPRSVSRSQLPATVVLVARPVRWIDVHVADETGVPVGEAHVATSLVADSQVVTLHTAQTSSHGRCRVPQLGGSDTLWWIDASKASYTAASHPGGRSDVREVELRLTRATTPLLGVLRAPDGMPLADVRVRCIIGRIQHDVATTDADGRFGFHVPPGSTGELVSDPAASSCQAAAVFWSAPRELITIQHVSARAVPYEVVADCKLESVRVDHGPLDAGSLDQWGKGFELGAQGALGPLPVGQRTKVTVQANGATLAHEVTVDEDTELRLEVPCPEAPVLLRGHVRFAGSDRPTPSVEGPTGARAAATARSEIESLTPTSDGWDVAVRLHDWVGGYRLEVSAPGHTTCTVGLREALALRAFDVELQPLRQLSVSLRNEQIASASLFQDGAGTRRPTTWIDGVAVFSALEPGRWWVTACGAQGGVATATVEIDVADHAIELDVVDTELGRVFLVDGSGAGVPAQPVKVLRLLPAGSGRIEDCHTAGDGQVPTSALGQRGFYRVILNLSGNVLARDFELAGDAVEIALVAPEFTVRRRN